jgi:hypothetical protein
VSFLARVGFLARGIMYVVIGWIALEVAFRKTGQVRRSPRQSSTRSSRGAC